MSINRWMDKEGVVQKYSEILLSHKKEQIWVGWTKGDEPRICYTEWSQSKIEKQILLYSYIYTHMYIILKNGTDEATLQAGMERIHRVWTCGLTWVRRGWDDLGAYHWYVHTTTCKTERRQEAAVWCRELSSVRCCDPEGWDGGEWERVSQGRGYMYT